LESLVSEHIGMRSGVGQASNAEGTAASTGATLGGEAQGIGSVITPFLTQEMQNPQGIGQTGLSAETASALGGAGGSASGLTGVANQRAAVSRNAGGFQAALDDASRNRDKAAAGASEGITANNENLKMQQQQDAARGLQGMYGTDTSGMLQSQGQEANDINAEANANKTGWLQNALAIGGMVTGGGNAAANIMNARN
jgi:hypothetical protein